MPIAKLTGNIGKFVKSKVSQNMRALTTNVTLAHNRVMPQPVLTSEHEWKLYGFNPIEYNRPDVTISPQEVNTDAKLLDLQILTRDLDQNAADGVEGHLDQIVQQIPQYGQADFYISSEKKQLFDRI